MSDAQKTSEQIANEMSGKDNFSQWLGIRIVTIEPGYCELQMQVRDEMCNGFGIAHGGIAFAFADSCCSFAVNAHGRKSLSVETSINQFKAIQTGDAISCGCREESLGKKLAVYTAEVTNADGVKIALFKGIYYRSDKRWFEKEESDLSA